MNPVCDNTLHDTSQGKKETKDIETPVIKRKIELILFPMDNLGSLKTANEKIIIETPNK